MPNTTVFTNNQYYQDIAQAIRNKNGQSTLYKPSEMAPAIDSLVVSGQQVTLQDKTVNPTTSVQTISKDAGYTGLGIVTVNAIQTETKTASTNGVVTPTSGKFLTEVTVNVPSDINNQNKGTVPTTSTQIITPDAGYSGLGRVTVEAIPSQYVVPTGTMTIINNGTYAIEQYASVDVDVPIGEAINNQNKTVTPTESTQSITADSGYTGLGTVTVNAISNTYVGSGIIRNPTLTASGATVTAPAGYYTTDAIKTVSSAAQATPAISVGSNGLITATVTQSTGWVIGGTKTATQQLTVQAAKIVTPSTTSQTAVVAGRYTTGAITVAAIQTEEKTAVSNGEVTPSSGKYLTKVTVNVPSDIHNQNKTVEPTKATQLITADSGYSGLGTVTIDPIPDEYIIPEKTITISSNGTVDVTTYASADVDVQPTLQTKSVTPTESSQTITASSGYDGLSSVTVGAISTTYVGTGVTRGTASSLTASGATVTVPAGYYSAAVSKSVATATQATPAVTISSSTGLVTATATQTAGYVSAGSKSGTLQLSTQSATTATPTNSEQTIVTAGKYTLGAIKVAAVPTQTKTTTVNGTVTPDAGKFLSSVTVNVPVGATINNQDKTVTPTKAQQSIVADSGYTGLGEVTVEAIPAAYITTSDANATASQILNNRTAYVNGSKVTGSMPNNGATGGTITTQGGTYAIPAGYTSGGTVTASLPVSTITNGVLNVATVTEATGDYGVQASITIPAGYYSATTLSKVLSTVLPAPATAISISQMLAGYQAYNNEGQLLTGTMANQEDWGATLDQTTTSVTIPEGYHDGTGKVSHTTVNIPDPTFSMNNSTGVITASGTWARGFTTDNSYTKTYSLTTQTGTTITPTETAQTAVAANRWTTGTVTIAAIPSTYVGSGVATRSSADLTVSGATITAPAGYYSAAASKSVASMTLPTSASTTSTSGATRKATIDRSTSVRYINIPVGYNDTPAYYQISAVANGSATNSGTASASSATLTTGNNTITLSKAVSITPNVTAGYISSGTAGNVTVQLTATVTTKAAATYTPGTTTQTISANQYLTGAQTIAGDADLVAGNIASGVTIFGVEGTFTADASATAADIVAGETAYVDGRKVEGTLIINRYYTGSNAPASSLGNNGDIYFQN